MNYLRSPKIEITGKLLIAALMIYVILGGLLFEVPRLPVIHQSIRNIYFHVGMWFSMIFMLAFSLVYSLRYLRSFDLTEDHKALTAVKTAMFFAGLGLVTGMIWAHHTWGRFWVNDPKLNGALAAVLSYMAYLVLRASLDNPSKRARMAAVYNIFAFVLSLVFIMILPRMASFSIHPGTDGNPALATGDLDPLMRRVFFPAIIGWFGMAWWVFRLWYRTERLSRQMNEWEEEFLMPSDK